MMRTNTSSVVYRTLILVLGLIITSTLSSIGGTWSSTTSILRSSQHRRQVNIHPFRLYSSLISVPNEMPNESIHQNQSDSSSSSTRSSSGSTDRSSRSDFNLTGICSGDGFQCALPEREFKTSKGISYHGPSSHQILMRFTTGPNRIVFLCKPDEEAYQAVVSAIDYLEKKQLTIFVEAQVHAFLQSTNKTYSNIQILTPNDVNTLDLVIAFGGDGLLMHANTLFNEAVPPVMCFNFGSLGFLAPFSFTDYQIEIDRILNGSALLTLRMRLQCTIVRNHTVIGSYRVLNEVVVDRGPSPYLSTVDLSCDHQYLTTLQGDGIIIATPTGSTAYSLAAGGSMVHPSVPAILLTPICAHTLSFRPLVLPDSCILTAEVPADCRANGWVSFDGKFRQELIKGDRLEVKMSSYPLPTVNKVNFTADWFQGLRSAFLFNERPRQKPLL